MAGRSPKVRRRRLGIELRQLREDAQYTIEQVAARLEVSDSKISRIETGQVGATPRDVRDMAALYGVTGQRMENLMQLARETREREKPWWDEYKGDLLFDFAAYEAEASNILIFSPMVLPGLLQTADYARAIIREIRFDLAPEQIGRRVEFRMKRQALLTAPNPPILWAVIDEAVLRRMIGGPRTMREQFEKLVEIARLPHVTVQLLPFSVGAHAGLDGPFFIIHYDEPTDRDLVYFEHTGREHFLDDSRAITLYSSLFDHIRAAALKPDDSIKLLIDRADELNSQ
jgi:transcriptional regulator with XRE-family HTH domain